MSKIRCIVDFKNCTFETMVFDFVNITINLYWELYLSDSL